jgi:DNA-binding PucR family transcriptional regulator
VLADGGLAGEHAGALVLLVPGRDAAGTARRLSRRLSTGVAVTVGAAGPASGARAVAGAYREALRCVDVLLSLGRAGDAASPDELGVYGVLLSSAGRDDLLRFVERTVGPVLEYDARRGSELARTVLRYFELDGNLARTAAELFVHVNTLYQRLDRVTSLLGEGWRRGDQALQVHLALKVHSALLPPPDDAE